MWFLPTISSSVPKKAFIHFSYGNRASRIKEHIGKTCLYDLLEHKKPKNFRVIARTNGGEAISQANVIVLGK